MIPAKKQKTELLVGVFVFFGLILLGGLILKFGDFRYSFREKYPLTVVFTDAGNLTKGAPVRRGGVEIGRVTKDPTLIEGISGVKVLLVVYQEFHISRESLFAIKTDGIIGDTFIEVTPPEKPSGVMLSAGYEIVGTNSPDISSTATRVADKTVLALEDIRSSLVDVKGALGRVSTGVLGDENLLNVKTTLQNLNTAMTKLDQTVLSEKNTDDVSATLENLKTTSLKLDQVAAKADQAVASVNTIIEKKLAPAMDEFGKAATSVRKAAEGLGLVANDIDNGGGLISGLLKDKKIRDDFSALVSNLRRNGVLWYKDDAVKEALQNQSPPPPRKSFFRR